MLKQLKLFCLMASLGLLSACGFQFQTGELIPQELRQLKFESNDPYSEMSMAMRKQLQANNIEIVEQNDVPVLRINRISTGDDVVSVFKQGREAESLLELKVQGSVKLKNQQNYQIEAKVNRTFFDNSRAALAKSAEREMIWRDLHEQAARQLISKMVALQYQINHNSATK